MQSDSQPRHVISQRTRPHFAWRLPARGHVALALLVGLPLALTAWGIVDNIAPVNQRVRDPLQALLHPSGFRGQRFGIIGLGLLFFMWLYPMHRKFKWSGSSGSLAGWMKVQAVVARALAVLVAVSGGRARDWERTGDVGAKAPRAACAVSSARRAADGTAHVPEHARPAREVSRV